MTSVDTSAWQLGYRFSRRPNAVEVPVHMLDTYTGDDLYDSPPIGAVITRLYLEGRSDIVAALVSDGTGFDWLWLVDEPYWRPAGPTSLQSLGHDNPDELAGA